MQALVHVVWCDLSRCSPSLHIQWPSISIYLSIYLSIFIGRGLVKLGVTSSEASILNNFRRFHLNKMKPTYLSCQQEVSISMLAKVLLRKFSFTSSTKTRRYMERAKKKSYRTISCSHSSILDLKNLETRYSNFVIIMWHFSFSFFLCFFSFFFSCSRSRRSPQKFSTEWCQELCETQDAVSQQSY